MLFVTAQMFAQTIYPRGTYMDIEELKNKTPSRPFYNYQIFKRTSGEILMNGGNDYRIESKNDSITKKIIRKDVFAISTGDSLYINGLNYKLQNWYCLARQDGDYLYFKGGACMDFKSPLATSEPAIGGIAGANQAKERYLYYLNLNKNTIDVLTVNNINKLATQKDSLITKQFQAEPQKDEKTVIKYYKIIKAR